MSGGRPVEWWRRGLKILAYASDVTIEKLAHPAMIRRSDDHPDVMIFFQPPDEFRVDISRRIRLRLAERETMSPA